MKKIKYLVLSMVVAIALVGAGYAAWTDNILINTQVNTGMLDLSYVDIADELVLPEYVTGNVGYAQDQSGDNDWDKAKVTLSNLYPGAKASVMLKIQNNSTIPVKMNAITDVRSENWGLNGVNFAQIGACVRFYDANGTALAFDNTTTYANPWEPAHLANTLLPVGGWATIEFEFTASDSIAELATYTFDVTALFKQFNQ